MALNNDADGTTRQMLVFKTFLLYEKKNVGQRLYYIKLKRRLS